MSALDPRAPVLVGVGQVVHRGDALVDPISLAAEATRLAFIDCGSDLPVDTVAMPGVLAPRTEHPSHRLSASLGLTPRRLLSSTIGGNTPQWLVGRLGTDILEGRCAVALVAGAEAGASARRARKTGVEPPTVHPAGGRDTEIGDTRMGASPAELRAGLAPPPFLYPILESAVAHHAGRNLDEQRRFLGRFMAPATEVAASHPDLAWFPTRATARELSEPTPGNRMIAEPYTKRMNAIIEVDQASAFLLCSVEAAEAAGIPRDRWVFPLGVADLNDVFYPLERPELHRSPAIETAGRALFEAVGCNLDDVSRFDFYSCFPVAVEISATALGLALDDERPLTVTGGHAYFGGPGNNYTTHSIATMAEQLRGDPITPASDVYQLGLLLFRQVHPRAFFVHADRITPLFHHLGHDLPDLVIGDVLVPAFRAGHDLLLLHRSEDQAQGSHAAGVLVTHRGFQIFVQLLSQHRQAPINGRRTLDQNAAISNFSIFSNILILLHYSLRSAT